ncbi:hypothetical protein A3709_19365 [Halioglobus sp. HI00S01]|uniref:DUF551 domain-containing protein n=1 Tax=Halioglobus sp. HI00S01 TaxID=1822214 RepID=UPI0007C2DDD7|nr:DUF551 domain-containing protein [Halioglobus sp. HI00S01]KZX57784.1 hypothetical protein A3709_19365 [Halioglobus sp. HI00S01]
MSDEELADFIERVTGERPKHGQLIRDSLSGLPEAYAKLEADNKRLQDPWIPVGQALPELTEHVAYDQISQSDEVWVWMESSGHSSAHYYSDGTWFDPYGAELSNITHWMHMPIPPSKAALEGKE